MNNEYILNALDYENLNKHMLNVFVHTFQHKYKKIIPSYKNYIKTLGPNHELGEPQYKRICHGKTGA